MSTNDAPESAVSTAQVVCPLCVQWLCCCGDWACNGDCTPQSTLGPVLPDGSPATLTQDNYCDRCTQALADYEEAHRGDEPF